MLYFVLIFSIFFLHFQWKYSRIGKPIPCILLAIVYSGITAQFLDSKIIFLAMFYIVIALWLMALIAYYKQNNYT
ncbi:hypothetical protein [Solibacillus sp. CAU 1738]|uniref:hypothetical protein n=1 Tax=Solibacillus sp. CAU 1738 TaxID=3140363 RepID=UPI0032607119